MFNLLGNAWWGVRKTKKRYIATRNILAKAMPKDGDINLRPMEVSRYAWPDP
jgi:hypothetical protein